MTILFIILWLAIGEAAIQYYWRRDWNKFPPILLVLFVPLLGPIAWPVGALVHSNSRYYP